MKKLLGLTINLSFMMVLFFVMASAHAGTTTRDLWAGQDIKVGKVTVSDDGTTLTVEYEITVDDWCLTETHLYVGTTPPEKSAPGQFSYSNESPDCDKDSYEILLSDLGVTGAAGLYVAAHAVVCSGQIIIVAGPPEDAIAYYYYPNDDSYGKIVIIAADGSSQTYDGWCADPYSKFKQGIEHEVDVTAFNDFLGLQSLDLINYIINHKGVYYGWLDIYDPEDEYYDRWDIQATIWYILGYDEFQGYAIPEIVNDAIDGLAGGWTPGCGDVLAYIVEPTSAYDEFGNLAQLTIIEVPIECFEICETAWAFNEGDPRIDTRPGKGNWSRYFETHTVTVNSSVSSDGGGSGNSPKGGKKNGKK